MIQRIKRYFQTRFSRKTTKVRVSGVQAEAASTSRRVWAQPLRAVVRIYSSLTTLIRNKMR